METPHNAPPRIALALPTEQQVLGERERERESRCPGENRLDREKSRILTTWEGEFGGCLLNANGPAHSYSSHSNDADLCLALGIQSKTTKTDPPFAGCNPVGETDL